MVIPAYFWNTAQRWLNLSDSMPSVNIQSSFIIFFPQANIQHFNPGRLSAHFEHNRLPVGVQSCQLDGIEPQSPLLRCWLWRISAPLNEYYFLATGGSDLHCNMTIFRKEEQRWEGVGRFLKVSLVSLLQLSPPRDAASSEEDFLTIPDSAGKLVVCQCAFHSAVEVHSLTIHSLGILQPQILSWLPL